MKAKTLVVECNFTLNWGVNIRIVQYAGDIQTI